ncbi:MAG TPA: flavoprotein [Phycisphaerae bacterium]|nr:flavoprotein [Phycisphaerae bacterium]
MPKFQRSILVCVCGGIAAYKVCYVVSKLVQSDVRVDVAMTAEAGEFVGPITFEALTGRAVHTEIWKNPDASTAHDPQHIGLAHNSDLILVAPATANILAKMAHGIADDLVSTLLLAAQPKKIFVAPAMNQQMWENPATQANVKLLQQRDITLIGPDTGWQACRTVGVGRMSEPKDILKVIGKKLKISI